LNLDAAVPFEITTPPVEQIPVDPIAELHPSLVYDIAVKTQPLQKANEYRLLSAKRNTAAAKGQMYPSIGGFVNLNSSYSSAQKTINTGTPNIEYHPSTLYVLDPIGGVPNYVYT